MEDSKFTKNVRVRLAPSPTGWIHIGTIRQIIFNYLWAKKTGGKFILRVEDTDVKRTVPGGIDSIYETFDAFGIDVDEGPRNGGNFGPYIQSERLDLYKKYAEELVEKGAAYYCFCSEDRLARLREDQMKKKFQPMYDGKCRNIDLAEAKKRVESGEKAVIRLKVPKTGFTEYEDVIHGKLKFKNSVMDDQVLLKSDGYPTYMFAVVVDDHLMEISHVIRGEEYLSSAPKISLVYRALGWEEPYIIQTPNVLNPDGRKKLSKRDGDSSASKYLRKGYLIEALWNFLVLLGWAPSDEDGNPDEIYSKDELIKLFDLRRIQKAGARFLPEKLDHFNGIYIRKLSVDDFYQKVLHWAENFVLHEFISDKVIGYKDWEKDLIDRVEKYLPQWKKDPDATKKALKLIQERIRVLMDIPDQLAFLYEDDLSYHSEDFESLKSDDIQKVLEKLWNNLKPVVEKGWKQETWEQTIRDTADQFEWKHGDMFMLLRLAVIGSKFSPPLLESMELMGVEKCNQRVKSALKFLSK